jgi:HlyD family secretion protein
MEKIGKIFVFIVVGIIIIATFKFLWDNSRPEISTYEIISPILGNIDNVTTVTGNIEPRNETAVKPEIPGIISGIIKSVGQNVIEGDIIATLRIVPDAAQITSAESRLRITNISLDQTSKQYARQKELYDNDVISKNDFEIIEAAYNKAKEEKENAEVALEIATKGYSRRSRLVDNTLIRSRSSGTILDIPVKVGDVVIQSNPFNEGTTIAIVADMKDLIFKGTVDESDVGNIEVGMPVSITVGAITNETIDAIIEYISPKGKKESGSVLYEIKAALSVPKATLIRANYSANANIIIEQAKDVIKIPESSVEFSKSGLTFVYILKSQTEKQQFIKRAIDIGL